MVASATRAELLADKLRQAIRAGVYVSGDRLVELTLAGQFRVSQNTVRDALRLLEAEGWVVKQARYGAYVRNFKREEVIELYALWEAIECLALRWAMEASSRKDLTQLRRLIQEARKQSLMDDPQEAMRAIFEFHRLIGEMSGKVQTQEMLASLHNRMYLLEVIGQMRAPHSLHTQEARLLLYEKLVTIMDAKDAEGALELLSYLIQSERDALLPLLE